MLDSYAIKAVKGGGDLKICLDSVCTACLQMNQILLDETQANS